MPDKVLFLDFDGVLHPTSHGSVLFSQMNLLEEAVGNESCQIVISSSWRFHMDLDRLRGQFSRGLQERILGVTGEPYIGSYARFHEINAYVQDQGISDWRALDDSFWEFPKGCDQLIRCNPNTGMSSVEVNLVKSWLESRS
jgi:hypothetical protein